MATPFVKIEAIPNVSLTPFNIKTRYGCSLTPASTWKTNSDDVVQYSYDNSTWYNWDGSSAITWGTAMSNGDSYNAVVRTRGTLYLRGKLSSQHAISSSSASWSLSDTGSDWGREGMQYTISGSISALFDYTNPSVSVVDSACAYMFYNSATYTHLTSAANLELDVMSSNCYNHMFYGQTRLLYPPRLPKTTLSSSCYYYMFYGCTNLVIPPSLPATTLAQSCYGYMFQGCTSLIAAPALPATTLATYCYNSMFRGCTSLIIPPSLPATATQTYAYYYMFQGCTSLIVAPHISATNMQQQCCYYMFQGCTSLIVAPKILATSFSTQACECMFKDCSSLSISTSGTRPPIFYLQSGMGYYSNSFTNMFQNTGGSVTTDPQLNVKYYSDPGSSINAKVYDVLITAIANLICSSKISKLSSGTRDMHRTYISATKATRDKYISWVYSPHVTIPSGYSSPTASTVKSELDAYLNNLGIGSTTAFKAGVKAEAKHYIYLTQAIAEFISKKVLIVYESGSNVGSPEISGNDRWNKTYHPALSYYTGTKSYNNPTHVNKTASNITEGDITNILDYMVQSLLDKGNFVTPNDGYAHMKSSSSSSSSSCSSSSSSSSSCSCSSIFIAYFNI